jgi:hypothetical protein
MNEGTSTPEENVAGEDRRSVDKNPLLDFIYDIHQMKSSDAFNAGAWKN